MLKKNDPYTFTRYCPLWIASKKLQIGNLFLQYQVTSYEDVQLADSTVVTKKKKRQFLVHCTQKINIWNPSAADVSPDTTLKSYDDYPVMINTSMNVSERLGIDWQLMNYSPQTVNTKVQSSLSNSDTSGSTKENSTSSTVGSSMSETNSYGASVTSGLQDTGEFLVPSVSVSSNWEHSSTRTHEHSSTHGSELSRSRGHDISGSASMSVKDWGAYGMVNPKTKNPTWTFGQEYPWDVIDCRKTTSKTSGGQVQLVIPTGMLARLFDGQSALYPPSQLSMFGINFLMKALWLLTVDDDVDKIEIDHLINYFSASHSLVGEPQPNQPPPVEVYMDRQPVILASNPENSEDTASTTIDLQLMALDPLAIRNRAAIVGFTPNKFVMLPAAPILSAAPIRFKIVSTTNDLLIVDTTNYSASPGGGFTASQTAFTAAFSEKCKTLQMTLFFKVIDTVSDYTVFLKHWKTGATDIALTFVINGDTDNSITKYVDALEAEGGEKNLLSFSLRNQDYASIDYHDYLQLGLNSIQVTIAPLDGKIEGAGYQIRAISIEKV